MTQPRLFWYSLHKASALLPEICLRLHYYCCCGGALHPAPPLGIIRNEKGGKGIEERESERETKVQWSGEYTRGEVERQDKARQGKVLVPCPLSLVPCSLSCWFVPYLLLVLSRLLVRVRPRRRQTNPCCLGLGLRHPPWRSPLPFIRVQGRVPNAECRVPKAEQREPLSFPFPFPSSKALNLKPLHWLHSTHHNSAASSLALLLSLSLSTNSFSPCSCQ